MLRNNLKAHEIKFKDLEVFKHLTRLEYEKHAITDSNINNPYNFDFTIKFYFDTNTNPYFTNNLLQKTFFMIDEETPLKSEGTFIEWKEGKKLTSKKVTRVINYLKKLLSIKISILNSIVFFISFNIKAIPIK